MQSFRPTRLICALVCGVVAGFWNGPTGPRSIVANCELGCDVVPHFNINGKLYEVQLDDGTPDECGGIWMSEFVSSPCTVTYSDGKFFQRFMGDCDNCPPNGNVPGRSDNCLILQYVDNLHSITCWDCEAPENCP